MPSRLLKRLKKIRDFLRRLVRRRRVSHSGADAAPPRSTTVEGREEAAASREDVAWREDVVSRQDVERLVGMTVGDIALYEQALMHRSMLRGEPDTHLQSNERLEFLGDAVLGFVTAEHLYREFPDRDEGFLTRVRAKIVNGQALARFATRLGLGPLILMSANMDQSGGRQNPTLLADALEAVIGALYLDLGEEAARRFVEEKILKPIDLEDLAGQRDNYKSLLLEYAQGLGWSQPQYRIAEEHGPSHDKTFTVEVLIEGEMFGRGTARSKKTAEQQAAGRALDRIREDTRHAEPR